MIGLYVVGEPGVGKSTVMRALTTGWDGEVRKKPLAHVMYRLKDGRSVVELGAAHPQFPGTDRLSMSVQPVAVDFIAGAPASIVLGEGDRLATGGFLDALEAATAGRWRLVRLTAPAEVLTARREARGSNQNESWLRGRATKVDRLCARFEDRLVPVDATGSSTGLAFYLERVIASLS